MNVVARSIHPARHAGPAARRRCATSSRPRSARPGAHGRDAGTAADPTGRRARGGRPRRPQLRAPRALTALFKPFPGALRGPLQVPLQNICSVRGALLACPHVPQAQRPWPASCRRRRPRDRLRHAWRVRPRADARGGAHSRADRPASQTRSPARLGGAGEGSPQRLWGSARDRDPADDIGRPPRVALSGLAALACELPRGTRALRDLNDQSRPEAALRVKSA